MKRLVVKTDQKAVLSDLEIPLADGEAGTVEKAVHFEMHLLDSGDYRLTAVIEQTDP
jgi:ribulose 1,5-bisphosphate synthetase/thiazole synthase